MVIKNKGIFLIPLSAIVLLAGFFLFKNSQTADKISNSNDSQNLDASNQLVSSKIVIDAKKCIGCGRCTKISPANFKMDNSVKKAIVVSSENFDSTLVNQAINSCPVAAISLN